MKFKYFLSIFFLMMIYPSFSFSYGPIAVTPEGKPFKWKKFPLLYNVENGPFKGAALCGGSSNQSLPGEGGGGCSLTPSFKEMIESNSEGISMIESAFQIWKNVLGTEFDFAQGGMLNDGGDVNICNLDKFFVLKELTPSDSRICGCIGACNEPCLNPIVFDSDGSITDFLFGVGAKKRIVGFGGPVLVRGLDYIPKMEALFNTYCAEPAGKDCLSKNGLNSQELESVILHELGHAIGLDHTQVSPQLVQEIQMNGKISPEKEEGIPTMYPLLIEGVNMLTLHADDIQSLRHLYKTSPSNFSSCTVEGDIVCVGCKISFEGDTDESIFQVKAGEETIPLSCVEMVAEAADPSQSLAVMSGAEVANDPSSFIPFNANSIHYDAPFDCLIGPDPNRCGHFKIEGLQPGRTYSIKMQPIASNLKKGSSINPCYYPLTGFKEDFGATISCTADAVYNLEAVYTSPK